MYVRKFCLPVILLYRLSLNICYLWWFCFISKILNLPKVRKLKFGLKLVIFKLQ